MSVVTLVTFVIVTGVETKTRDVTMTIVVTIDGWCECDEYGDSDKSCDFNGT